jgi:hypothetical protein
VGTRIRRIGAILIVALAALPATDAICAWRCSTGAGAASERQATAAHATCHEPSTSPVGTSRVQGVPGHDCTNHSAGAGGAAAVVTAGRVVTSVRAGGHEFVSPAPALLAAESAPAPFVVSPPGRGASPPRLPFVLRI